MMRSLFLALLLVTLPTAASADPTPATPDPHVGLFGGFSLEAGNLQCSGDNCQHFYKAGGADGHIGWGLSRQVGILLDVWWLMGEEDNLEISQTLATVGVRYWPIPIVWIQAGLGGAQAAYRYKGPFGLTFEDHTDGAAGFTAAVGVELIKGRHFALDVEGRIGFGFYGDNNDDGQPDNTGRSTSLGVGFTWF